MFDEMDEYDVMVQMNLMLSIEGQYDYENDHEDE